MFKKRRTISGRWIPPLSILCGLLLWELAVRISGIPQFILPAPSAIAERFFTALASGILLRNLRTTFVEVFFGLLCGSSAALLLGYLLSHSKTAGKILFPYLIASQAIPIAAIAPLLIIWLGSGIAPKILICALVVFFPILINVISGLQDIQKNYRDLMISMKTNRFAVLRYLEIPASMPIVLAGLKVGATLSVIGAVIGELIGANAGLGYLINVARGQFDTALVFVCVLLLMLIALGLYFSVVAIEKKLLRWKQSTLDLEIK